MAKLLILTNMAPKPSAPLQGIFVRNQVQALKDWQPEFYAMPWQSDHKLLRLLRYPIFWLVFVWRYILSRQTFDLIHVHFYYPTIWLALTYKVFRNRNVRIVVTCHGSDLYYYEPASWFYRQATRVVDYWIFVSEPLRQRFFKSVENSMVLPAGIHPAYSAQQFLPLMEKDLDVMFVGSLEHNKGVDRLLALAKRLPHIQFTVVGQGPLSQQLADSTAVQTNLHWVGMKEPAALAALYRRAKVALSLSRNESFGLVMTEAMACGTPVIATATDGAKVQIEQGRNGYMLSVETEQQLLDGLCDQIQQLFSLAPADYQQLQQGCQTSANKYALADIAKQLTTLYQQLLASN